MNFVCAWMCNIGTLHKKMSTRKVVHPHYRKVTKYGKKTTYSHYPEMIVLTFLSSVLFYTVQGIL